MIRYKGKGEHSVNQLEQIIEQQNEELHQLKTLHVKYLDRLRQQYKKLKEFKLNESTSDEYWKRRDCYDAMRFFCLDCNLLTFLEIEAMEFEVNQSFL
jgi:hypothetical protein